MRISDWSSDVCSSDLLVLAGSPGLARHSLTGVKRPSGVVSGGGTCGGGAEDDVFDQPRELIFFDDVVLVHAFVVLDLIERGLVLHLTAEGAFLPIDGEILQCGDQNGVGGDAWESHSGMSAKLLGRS